MARGIFVSYRRDDTRQAAGRLADDLIDHFGSQHIFRDIENIELGVEFAKALNQALEACVVMLVLIGPKWLDVRDAQGRRRLELPNDWIRQEIATALRRGIRVVPVLIDGTDLPDEAALPEDLQPLVRRQALELSDARWRGDLQKLVQTLERLPGFDGPRPVPQPDPRPTPEPKPGPSGKKQLWTGIAIGVFGLLMVAGYVAEEDKPLVDPQPPIVNSPQPPVPTANLVPPAPQPAPQPVASIPDLSGHWRTLGGETYQFTQRGQQVQFTAQAGGQHLGSGEGRLDGNLLRLNMTLVINGVPISSADCSMQASPDFVRFVGNCQTPNGPFPAQIFR